MTAVSSNSSTKSHLSEVFEHNVQRAQMHASHYWKYKRRAISALVADIAYHGKTVLEYGSGTGNNIDIIYDQEPHELVGLDYSSEMITTARKRISPQIAVLKIDDIALPLEDKYFDIVLVSRILQHIKDEKVLRGILSELCRVSSDAIYFIEKVNNRTYEDEWAKARPIGAYSKIMKTLGFELTDTSYVRMSSSYFVYKLLTQKLFKNKLDVADNIQRFTIPITKILDKLLPSQKMIAKMEYRRTKR